jgi:hypothetical protein
VCPDAVITVFRAGKKKDKEPIAVISNVKHDIKVMVDNPDVPRGEGRLDL